MDRSARGMSLIEIMIAVAVLTVALVGLLTTMPVATQATKDAEQHEVARHAIEKMITEIRAAVAVAEESNWENVADDFNGHDFDVSELVMVDDQTKCGVVEIDRDGPGPDGTKKVCVRIEWRGIDKAVRRVEVTTLVGR